MDTAIAAVVIATICAFILIILIALMITGFCIQLLIIKSNKIMAEDIE